MKDENGYGRGIQGHDPPEEQRSPSPGRRPRTLLNSRFCEATVQLSHIRMWESVCGEMCAQQEHIHK